jgi:hypothetical protein
MNGRTKRLALALIFSLPLTLSIGADGVGPQGKKVTQKVFIVEPVTSRHMKSDELRAFNEMLVKAINESGTYEVVRHRDRADWLFGEGQIQRHNKNGYAPVILAPATPPTKK